MESIASKIEVLYKQAGEFTLLLEKDFEQWSPNMGNKRISARKPNLRTWEKKA
jgi:hypothetical protein